MNKAYRPLIVAIAVVASIYLGSLLTPGSDTIIFSSPQSTGMIKLNEILNYIEESYVDTVKKEKLIEDGIQSLLKDLDPHSFYIPKDKFKDMNEGIEGNFEGIGVEFRIISDTVMVINAVPGGPSEKAGIKAGDRIVSVNDSVISGPKLRNKTVIKLLKGQRGTVVNVGIKRLGENSMKDFNISRDRIPIVSVPSSYMIDAETGYIRISRFSKNTYSEFIDASESLLDQGMKKLVLDLRGNPGGLLNEAVDMANDFLEKDKIIVYTEGKARPKKVYYSDQNGILLKIDLTVLIDDGSASASEIIAGAVQDNDRGIIVGRRSFGKGLVQEQIDWPDGSALRLTVARYYTPTGRSIQKPYKGVDDYHLETLDRYENGELENEDSIHFSDTLKFYTPEGKVVYGGGGIVPDHFVAADSLLFNPFYGQLFRSMSVQNFTFRFCDRLRKELLMKYPEWSDFRKGFRLPEGEFEKFINYAQQRGVEPNTKEMVRLRPEIEHSLKAQIARNLYGDKGYFPVLNETDSDIKKALELMP